MSRQHFEALAREIASIRDSAAREQAAYAVARAAATFNTEFNQRRFLSACGVAA